MDTALYLKNVWAIRYFWMHLALADISIKYRRSTLGLAWALIQPLSLTLLFTFVMGSFFKIPMKNYAPFIFSGMILWEFLVSSAMSGCTAFVNAEGYIKQFSHPLLIYTLRCVIPCMVNLLCAFLGLVIWILFWKPANFGTSELVLLIAFPLLFLFTWPITTIFAFIAVKFRDFSQLVTISLQAIYYVSPIMFLPQMFYSAHMGYLIDYNPLYHLFNLFRMPLLEGVLPSLNDIGTVFLSILVLWASAGLLIKRNEKKIIFYL